MFSRQPETWVPCTGAILGSLEQSADTDHLQLAFRPPAHEKTRHGIVTSEVALMVKVETRQSDERYTASVYMLRIKPDSKFPLLPVQEPPKEQAIWWELDWPYASLEVVE